MVREQEIRPGEVQVEMPDRVDAGLLYIGRIETPWTSRLECPRQGRHDGPLCKIEIFEPWVAGLRDVELYERLELLYWLDHSRRDLVLQSPKADGSARGVFSIRSPVRPNPIATSIVKLERIAGNLLYVRGLDCLNGTPLLDIKPDRTLFSPLAAAQKGDFQVGDDLSPPRP
jgi:tRNA-Thr(GGU) m(6)t(6)A37 methyltransferase TsaA